MRKLKRLSGFVFSDTKALINKTVKYRTKSEIMSNLKKNIPVVASLFLFMLFTRTFYFEGYFLSCIFVLLTATQISDLKERIDLAPISVKIYSLISSFGICFYAIKTNIRVEKSNKFVYWSIIAAAIFISIIGIYAVTIILLNHLFKIIKSVFLSLSKEELFAFSVISAMLIAFSTYSFLNSHLFWFPATGDAYDYLYTSDTASILNYNAYMTLFHTENDIRQPLFAVFAAPILGTFYSFSIPLVFIDPVFYALLMNVGQILMMTTANLMVIKLLEPSKVNSICLMVLLSLTHTSFLSTLMMEQYIIGYFYLILAIYYYITYNKLSELSVTAAAGTLFTSAILFSIGATEKDDLKSIFKNTVPLLVKNILVFIFFTIAFCRFDVIFYFINSIRSLTAYSNINNSENQNSVNQFFSFVASCFTFPDSAAEDFGKATWQLTSKSITDVNYVGIILLVLCLIGAVVNRKNTLTKIAALWTMLSVVLLGIVGWGSVENGMVLYSLYFCWAYFILLVQLLKWLSDKLKCKHTIIIASAIISILFIIVNYHGFAKLLSFAFSEYPY